MKTRIVAIAFILFTASLFAQEKLIVKLAENFPETEDAVVQELLKEGFVPYQDVHAKVFDDVLCVAYPNFKNDFGAGKTIAILLEFDTEREYVSTLKRITDYLSKQYPDNKTHYDNISKTNLFSYYLNNEVNSIFIMDATFTFPNIKCGLFISVDG